MEAPELGPREVAFLALYVALSSYLGLNGRWFFYAPMGGLSFMQWIWTRSLLADLVFTLGTAAVGWWAYRLACADTPEGTIRSVVAAVVLNDVVYAASYMLLGRFTRYQWIPPSFDVVTFVTQWGFVGLLFAGLAPAGLRAWQLRDRGEPEAPQPSSRDPDLP